MPHRTTVVELSIDLARLSSTVQDWAGKNKFSLYEKTDRRMIFSKSMRGAKAWLSVENYEDRAKLEAWLSSPGVGPEFTGNLWLGWKMALPEGFTFRTPFTYRKQFNQLLTLLKAGSSTESWKKSTTQDGHPITGLRKSPLLTGLMVFGIFYTFGGVISLVTAASLILHSSYLEIANRSLMDGTLNLILGVLLITSSRVLMKGKMLGLWLYGATILVEVFSTLARGESLSFLFIGFVLLMTWQMFKMKNEWKLA